MLMNINEDDPCVLIGW